MPAVMFSVARWYRFMASGLVQPLFNRSLWFRCYIAIKFTGFLLYACCMSMDIIGKRQRPYPGKTQPVALILFNWQQTLPALAVVPAGLREAMIQRA